MHDFTVVEFPKLGWSFNVPSILADFTIPGINLHPVSYTHLTLPTTSRV